MIQTVAEGRSLVLLQHQTVGDVSDAALLKTHQLRVSVFYGFLT